MIKDRLKIIAFIALFLVTAKIIILMLNSKTEDSDLFIRDLNNQYRGSIQNLAFEIDKKNTNLVFQNNNREQNSLFFYVKNLGSKPVKPEITVNEQNWFSNEAIRKSILGDRSLSPEELVILLSTYLHKHAVWSDPPFYESSLLSSPVRFLNLFGYGYCADFSYSLAILAELSGLKTRVVYLNGDGDDHVVTEVFYNGSWHMFDAASGIYFRNKDKKIASLEEIFNNIGWVNNIYKLDENIKTEAFLSKIFSEKKVNNNTLDNLFYKLNPILGWFNSLDKLERQPKTRIFLIKIFSRRKIKGYQYKENYLNNKTVSNFFYNLNPNEEIRFYYNWKDKWFWGDFPDKPQEFTNGLLITPLEKTDDFEKEMIKKIELPYAILDSYIQAKGICQKTSKIMFSRDGKNWVNSKDSCSDDIIHLNFLFSNGKQVTFPNFYYIKAPNSLLKKTKTTVYTQFQVAPNSIPKLKKGTNNIQLLNNYEKIKIGFGFKSRGSFLNLLHQLY